MATVSALLRMISSALAAGRPVSTADIFALTIPQRDVSQHMLYK